jgi:hypothetical protein
MGEAPPPPPDKSINDGSVKFIGYFRIIKDQYAFSNTAYSKPELLTSLPGEFKVIKITSIGKTAKYLYINHEGMEQFASGPAGRRGAYIYIHKKNLRTRMTNRTPSIRGHLFNRHFRVIMSAANKKVDDDL